ncbi:agmatinase [Aureivirga marina]|uniref:agmatinase n=1 Tax=Aureivirga marina TaxID=1182451 RepID=UPI0018C91EEA|nr:agmatinase [Aureivirga marina]
MRTFAGIDEKYASFENAQVLLQSIPYDETSTWRKGANKGFEAFLEASENMELYDIETDSEAFKQGIHILPSILEKSSPERMFQKVYENTKKLLEIDKFLTFFGGEHSISIGIIKAFYEKHPDITIVQLDAHADLRESYLGSKFNHACALHEASLHTNLIQVGIRSMDVSEKQFLHKEKCYFAKDIVGKTDWIQNAISQMGTKVYITIDLDVLDPAIMSATGTPEPGGLEWYPTLTFLHKIFEQKIVLGFDIVELAPIENFHAPQFLVAKLYYKLLSYRLLKNET